MTRADLLACLPEPVAPGRCRACPPLGCFFSICRDKCAAAGVPEAIAAQAEAEQIARELRASHGLALTSDDQPKDTK